MKKRVYAAFAAYCDENGLDVTALGWNEFIVKTKLDDDTDNVCGWKGEILPVKIVPPGYYVIDPALVTIKDIWELLKDYLRKELFR